MRVLVTGAQGFIGRYLIQKLEAGGVQCVAPSFDVTEVSACRAIVSECQFDAVFHMAGVSSVPGCEEDPETAFRVNVESTYRLASLVAEKSKDIHFIFPSTGQLYAAGFSQDKRYVFNEGDQIEPRNLYALTKYLAEEELRFLSQMKGMTVTILRIFNHVHKSQRPDFFLSSVYQQLLEAKKGNQDIGRVQVGNIDVSRDFGAIQDLLSALNKVILKGPVESGKVNLFNLSSGVEKNLRSLILCLAQRMSLTVSCIENKILMRSNEPKTIVASNVKFTKAYGWAPEHGLSEEQLIDAFLADL